MTKVSIVIPCYNQAEFVEDAILSAVNQTYQNIEIVCINDGSTDNTSEVVKRLFNKYKNIIFFDENENRGVVFARNFAIEACRGDYILPLDADDIIEPTYVEKAVKILDENPNIGIVYCRARIFGKENKIWELPDYNKDDILYENSIFCTALFRKSDFVKVGGYKTNMEAGLEDYDLWLSLIENGLDVYQINEILFNYRQYEKETRTDFAKKDTHKNFKQIIKNHIDLYLNNELFIKKITTNKEKKYKKRLIKLSLTVIIELIAILILCAILFINL